MNQIYIIARAPVCADFSASRCQCKQKPMYASIPMKGEEDSQQGKRLKEIKSVNKQKKGKSMQMLNIWHLHYFAFQSYLILILQGKIENYKVSHGSGFKYEYFLSPFFCSFIIFSIPTFIRTLPSVSSSRFLLLLFLPHSPLSRISFSHSLHPLKK